MFLASLIDLDKELLLMLNGSESLFLDGLAKTLTTATTWIPLYLALFFVVLKNNDHAKKVLLIVGCALFCVLLAGSIDDWFVKPAVARWRPTRDPFIGIDVDLVNGYRGGKFGFFSAHAANTFSLAVFFSLLIRNRSLTVAMVLWSLVNCWTRLYLGVHYPGDILVGLVWGGVVGVTAWYLYLRIYARITEETSTYVSTQYTATGYEQRDADVIISVLLFTLIYAILKACYYVYI